MRVVITGSRSATQDQVWEAVGRCRWIGFTTVVVSGTAEGADRFGELWAAERGLQVVKFPATWARYARLSGPLRNRAMAESSQGLIAVWDGQSHGTQNMIEEASRRGLRIRIHRTDGGDHLAAEINPSGVLGDLWDSAEERAAILEYQDGFPPPVAEWTAGARAARASILAGMA